MQQVVIKFGGTSVSTRATWNNIAAITQKHLNTGVQPVIVCSALTQISNKLEKAIEAALLDEHHSLFNDIQSSHLNLAEQLEVNHQLIANDLHQLQQWLTGISLLKQAPAKTHAQILSLGELMMTRLGHAFLEKQGIKVKWYDARELLTSTPTLGGETMNYLSARCESEYDSALVEKFLSSGAQAIITQGFFAANPHGETVLLGRGGSDTSAALLAGKLQAASCEIWTDVPGIYTANPHQLPHARLLKQLNYDEAQEIASMGAKVLHPNCIPPVRKANIPMVVKYTHLPEHSGTLITKDIDESAPLIKSIQVKHSILLISIDTLNMWQQVGFLADVFAAFKKHGFSVDLLSSSEFNVTLSLDVNAKIHDRPAINALLDDLNQFGRAKLIEPCSAVSLVGHHIRTVLPHLGPALEVFEAKQVYLMSLASNDLNLTFVVDESHADKLCQRLHHLLIESNPQIFYYSKSWHEEFGKPNVRPTPWWEIERDRLLTTSAIHSPCYVYHSPTQATRARQLSALESIDSLFYAIKANPFPSILKTLEKEGIGFECVSIQELELVLKLFPNIKKERILFTPNFAPKSEYEFALQTGCYVTIDSLYPLENWPKLFKDREVIVRIDPGTGAGHHKHVSTGGNESKFGITQNDISKILSHTKANHIKVIGLHAHSGSGILSTDLWQQTAVMLASLTDQFPEVRSINLGGGLGIVEKPGQHPIDFAALDAQLMAVKSQYPGLAIWLEPGRFFVAESGVILAKVTQCKEKGKVKFIGIETGMNSLIRPSLYGAYHEIINLTRLHEEKAGFAHIVGPICESGDTLGYDRLLPVTREGDVILIANTGAYGHCMSSHYNLRPPAQEIVLE
ncbi:TPA: bifunctional aspartate kinase/diaminopimelate decarboxylase [Legionella pneumophila]|uniref:bifunctional aspartate kinase/diaminopimelate decarboxylase n=1 Tax=Legionella pneumophila TaxID=446 RepID=UPI0007709D52|nr:bifunctional aspartate kinase/diaminopimelate decarboxylase [Legionella pneumophila]MDW9044252.1 bifunctional aspartate kinase/diaminopimelate decarboxylase [Legionella pneumophila]MDW9053598.1 bifunctional aspartate kinase/diaminopimelate decarboxylase [Legionella pneumophila]MDW9056605.1 bifunctional aspartate kinase/diaminopimelate decarboxylase [Legionella pneumophila]MDW9101638.1 bifunctional aspartate kinase/diaminopimelate decarboxylase [Legionella pneumophila]MDW9123211.1 bifunction